MSRIALYIACMVLIAACKSPAAMFEIVHQETTAPAEVTFVNKSLNAEQYSWNFGDTHVSSDSLPTHIYKSSGLYEVQLTALKGKKKNILTKKIEILAPKACLVEIETPQGNMLVELSNATPGHQDNFTKLAKEGFFQELLFHRVINGFMIQGGDPNSKNAAANAQLGSGGPGYTIPAEILTDSLVHVKGAIAAARTGDAVNPEKRSSGSQFYIVHGKPVTAAELDQIELRKGFKYTPAQRQAYLEKGGTPFLDGEYTVFGQVVEGLEVIDAIGKVKTNRMDRPETDVPMKMTFIH